MTIQIKYFHAGLNLGVADLKNVWLLNKEPVLLKASVHQGNLVYRMPVSGKRISYRTLKKGLIKKSIVIRLPDDPLLF